MTQRGAGHWLAERLAQLRTLSEAFESTRAGRGTSGYKGEHAIRERFHGALQELAEQIAERPGVVSCFVANEGLVFASTGRAEQTEAFAAMAQLCMEYGNTAARNLQLGDSRQLVLVGDRAKLALFPVGRMVLGIVAPSGASLSESLGRPERPRAAAVAHSRSDAL